MSNPNSDFKQSFLSFVEETTPGTTPSSPSMLKFRTTDPLAIQSQTEALQTEQPYSHRQLAMNRHAFKGVGGSLPHELSYGAFDAWIEALLGGAWSTETAGTPEILKIGNAIKTFTVERGFPDISEYEVFRGVIPNTWNLEINPQGIVTGDFGVIGMAHDALTSSSLGSATDVATNEPFDGLANASLQEGGSSIAIVSLTINNNRNIGRLVGSDEGDVPNNGMIQVEGTLTARFRDEALLNKFKNDTSSSLQVVLNDQGGSDSLTFDFHDINYNGGNLNNNNDTLDVVLPFVAQYDSGESTALTLTRSNAA